jgi:signal transduction histidine kinase
MTNLIDNALRHGRGTIELSATLVDGGVRIEVCDEGEGFSASYAPRAFDRMTRAEPADRSSGAGIGLAIVHAIAHAHGGTATVEVGAPGTVRVWLPADPRPSLE